MDNHSTAAHASGDITEADVRDAYPNWTTSFGVDQLCHASRIGGSGLTARGESWQDLLDEIRRAEAWLWEPGQRLSGSDA